MLLHVPGKTWVVSVLMTVILFCPGEVEGLFGIPEFLEMGDCAKVPLKIDFDPVKYSGLWFDIESVPNEYQYTKKCVTQNYSWEGDYMNVATRGLTSEDKKVRQSAVMRVETESVSSPNPAHMTVEATGVPAAPYQIVSSDYRTYSCVYSCLEYFGFRAEFFWVFGRTPTLPAEKIRLCHETFDSLGIDYKKMVPIIQGEPCPYNDNLPQLLRESDEHLLKVLGPYVPTSVAPTPMPTTTTTSATKTQLEYAIEKDLKEIKELVQEENKIAKVLEAKVEHSGPETPSKEAAKVPKKIQESDEDTNSASSSVPALILILLVPLCRRVLF